MNKQKIALIVASGLGMLAILMPWVNVPLLGSISGKQIPDDRCWLPSIIFAIPLIIALLGDRAKPLIGNIKYAAFIPGLINAIGGIMVIANFEEIKKSFLTEIGNKAGAFLGKDAMSLLDGLGGSIEQAAEQALKAISVGFGIYLIIIAGIGVCLISLFAKWFGNTEEPATEENDVLKNLHLLNDKFKHLPAGKRKLVIISLTSLALLIGIICIIKNIGEPDVDFSLVPVKGANGEYQYIDIPKKGKIVINPQFEQAHLFRDGLALVKTSGTEGKYGYIDKNGKLVIAPVYSKAQDFSDGVAWVQMENQPPMLIDKKGKMILQIDSLVAAFPFNDGIAGIIVYSRGQELTMFIDKKGNPEATVDVTSEFAIPIMKDGMYLFQDKISKKYGYKNKNGEIAINAQYDSIVFFLDGMATILNDKKWGVIDKKGNIVINPQYESLINNGNGLFSAKIGNKWGYVNKKNEITINPQFDLAMGFNGNKLAPVLMGDKMGYINKEGQLVINPQFRGGALPFNGDYAMVFNTEGKAGFIDKTGSFVVSHLYDLGNDLKNDDYLVASKQNITGGLPIQYNGDFDIYERLKEKIEEERLRAIAAASGSFTDSRDNKTYKTIKIGTQTWMAENLNYIGDGNLGLCHGDKPREQIRKPENCEKYGRLYDWSEAMGLNREYNRKKFGNDDNVQGVCPSGWHLPNKDEWNTLMTTVGGDTDGKKLKARDGWNEDGNGTDDFGFSALPGGLTIGSSLGIGSIDLDIGKFGAWWSATESNASRFAHIIAMKVFRNGLRGEHYKSDLASVRCIKDYEATAEEIAAATKASAEAKASAKTSTKSFTDSRDGTAYKTVTIGKQTWMAQNLNYNIEGGKCYSNNPENCEKYGRLYNWAAAIKACPSGWYLPSNDEWDILYHIADGTSGVKSPYKSETAGKYLKATSNWNSYEEKSGNGEDAYGFTALPGGSGNSSNFIFLGNNGYWWSATENDTYGAYYRFMLHDSTVAGWNSNSKSLLLSVRCIMGDKDSKTENYMRQARPTSYKRDNDLERENYKRKKGEKKRASGVPRSYSY
ncbi:MAG: WG repeat-containing protein [Fibromonadaceae bacterium]|jgi:uncharacterized protein (TIGR02145 family)|nr:WG repeat-containing protein [Fibromonadaceae bacterium]